MRGGGNIALPVARLAEILGVSPMHVSRFREYAKDDGFLREVKRAHHLSRQATIFKFVDSVAVAPEIQTPSVETERF
jgi:hypothetical protein